MCLWAPIQPIDIYNIIFFLLHFCLFFPNYKDAGRLTTAQVPRPIFVYIIYIIGSFLVQLVVGSA